MLLEFVFYAFEFLELFEKYFFQAINLLRVLMFDVF